MLKSLNNELFLKRLLAWEQSLDYRCRAVRDGNTRKDDEWKRPAVAEEGMLPFDHWAPHNVLFVLPHPTLTLRRSPLSPILSSSEDPSPVSDHPIDEKDVDCPESDHHHIQVDLLPRLL